MIAVTDPTKVTSVRRKHAPTSNLHVRVLATASHSHGYAMATTIALTNKTKKTVRPYHAWPINLSAPIYGNVSRNRTNAMAYRIVTMAATSSAVPQWAQTNATKRNISVANHRVYAYRLHGTAMDPTIVMTIRTKRTAAKYRAQPISTSATIHSASSRRTFAMAKMIAAIIPMKVQYMRACHRLSSVPRVNGFVRVLRIAV